MGCSFSKACLPSSKASAAPPTSKADQAARSHLDVAKGDGGQHIEADAAGATARVVPPTEAKQTPANAALQQRADRDLVNEEPVTTAAQDADVVKDRPNLAASEFEAITSQYKGAPLPENENERYASLCRLEQMDTPEDPRFDDITALLCSIFKVPMALVSLVDNERQWFKSVQGLAAKSTERKAAFCAWTFLPVKPKVLVVPDALLDGRFKENPLVLGPPHLRFYAGAPLVDSTGCRLGSLCVLDHKPREFDAENCNVLCNFAEVVVREMEKDKRRDMEAARVQTEKSNLLRAMDCFTEGVMLLNVTTNDFRIMFLNDAWARITGFDKESSKDRPLWDLFEPARDAGESLESATADQRQAVKKQLAFTVELNVKNSDRLAFRSTLTANFRPAATQTLDTSMPLIGIHGGSTTWTEGHTEAEGLYFVTINESSNRPSRSTSITSSTSHSLGSPNHGLGKSARKGAVIADNGQPFEDLQLGPLLGQGSFGKVYRGMWSGAPVAVKIIQHTDEVTGSDGDVMSLSGTLEAMHSVDLAHPNVVQTYKSAQKAPTTNQTKHGPQHTQTETWLVLEYCDRGTLQDSVDRGNFNQVREQLGKGYQPNLNFVRDTAREIAAAMCYLHSLDILHGDLTGGNILLISSNKDQRGFIAKVADFGLSRVLSAEAVSTGTYGTVTHMPIELLTTGKLGKPTDVYAFGVILWELLTGQRPWAGLLQMQVIFHVTIHRKRLELPESCHPGFKSLCEACMNTESSERPRFTEVLAQLDSL